MAGGIAIIINNFDIAVGIKKKASSHKHKSSEKDENIILSDLLELKPFASINDHLHEGFTDISSDTLATLDNAAFYDSQLNKHKRNITKHVPVRAFFNYITGGGGGQSPPAPMVATPLNHFAPPSQSPFSLTYKQNMEFRREV